MRVLSLDLGTKSLGSCISDKSNLIAVPLENFLFEENVYKDALERVVEIVEEYSITLILLGHPKRQDGTKSEMTIVAEEFFEKIKNILPDVEIKLFDERYTTQRGIQLIESKYKGDKEKIKELKDMAAAYVMLTDYLSTI